MNINFSVQNGDLSLLKSISTIGLDSGDPVVKTISFTYNLDDITPVIRTYPPFTYGQSSCYNNSTGGRTKIGYDTFIYQFQQVGEADYFNTIINWSFVLDSLQNPLDPLNQPNVVVGSGLYFKSSVEGALLPFNSSWNGTLSFNGVDCGNYTLQIDGNGRRNFVLSLTRNI